MNEADPYMDVFQSLGKQSEKRSNLRTILVNETSLANTVVKTLYDRLRQYGPSTKMGKTMYKLSKIESSGVEFLQQWRTMQT